MRRAWLLPWVLVLASCELQEVSLAEPEDVVVAEVVLRAWAQQQLAVLHRTIGTGTDAGVPGANIEAHSETGGVLVFMPAADSVCFSGLDEDDLAPGSCYATPRGEPPTVLPGERYTLRIELPDGGVLTGATTVPGAFDAVTPEILPEGQCRLAPDTRLELLWTRSSGAWVYIVETRMQGLAAALRARGVTLEVDPVRFVGLSISATDTTLTFPTELGVFDRFDNDVAGALVAIQNGLPPDVDAQVMISAADRNYVNWVRGGRFNPSGLIRTPSITGSGTGVFGSINPYSFRLTTFDRPRPAC